MNIFIATDVHLFLSGKKIYASQQHSTIFRRYYQSFGNLNIMARFNAIGYIKETLDDITDLVDSIIIIHSLKDVLIGKCDVDIEDMLKRIDLVICRCPSICAFRVATLAKKRKRKYFAEVMGDAWDAYWNHGISGKLIAPYMFYKMKWVVKNADFGLYVTNSYLQNRYPCPKKTVAASNVFIEKMEDFILEKRIERIKKTDYKNITIITVADVDVWYKGQQYVIKSIPELNNTGIHVNYYLVGGGTGKFLRKVAGSCKVSEQVIFTGRVSMKEVLHYIDNSDIYIQPSLQEGLPRSVIEAMSRGCICIGAKTAGIPELLGKNMIAERKNVNDITRIICQYCALPLSKKIELAIVNYEKAKEYQDFILSKKRIDYFEYVKKSCLSYKK